MSNLKTKNIINKTIIYVILIAMVVIMMVPFVWMLLTAVKTNQEAISVSPFYFFPQHGWHIEKVQFTLALQAWPFAHVWLH